MPHSYYKELEQDLEEIVAMKDRYDSEGRSWVPDDVMSNVKHALGCLEELDFIYGMNSDYEEACEEEKGPVGESIQDDGSIAI